MTIWDWQLINIQLTWCWVTDSNWIRLAYPSYKYKCWSMISVVIFIFISDLDIRCKALTEITTTAFSNIIQCLYNALVIWYFFNNYIAHQVNYSIFESIHDEMEHSLFQIGARTYYHIRQARITSHPADCVCWM